MSPKKCFITVAVCTRNRAAALSAAVQSVLPQLDDETELLIVDNGSTDATRKITSELMSRHSVVRVIVEDRPGISFARNTAFAHARGQILLFFDDDELAEPGWFAAYRKFFQEFSSRPIGSVGGSYIAQHETAPPVWLPPDYGAFDLGSERQQLTGKTGPAGGNCAYVKDAVLKTGGFAADLVRHEDSEMNSRLREAGYEVWWLPEARVRHIIPTSRLRFGNQVRLWFLEGKSALVVRWRAQKNLAGRFIVVLTRAMGTPVQIVLQLTGAILLLLLWRRRAAARLLLRACRSAGIFVQAAGMLFRTSPKG